MVDWHHARLSQRRATHRARRPEEAEAETRICAPHIMSPNGILKMSKTRFICARKSWHVDHRGDPLPRSVRHLARCGTAMLAARLYAREATN